MYKNSDSKELGKVKDLVGSVGLPSVSQNPGFRPSSGNASSTPGASNMGAALITKQPVEA